MVLKIWRFLTLMIIVFGLGPALAHLFELPAKLNFGGELWLELLQRLYPPAFGTIGAVFEVSAVASAAFLVFLVRHRRPAFGWTLAGALFLAASHAAFWIWVAPVNATMMPLTADTLPANWSALRDQWEYAHAARAMLQLLGFGAILVSVVIETPRPHHSKDGMGPGAAT